MAVPYECSVCGGDGTRCRCGRDVPTGPRARTIEERIADNEAEIARNLAELERLSRRRR